MTARQFIFAVCLITTFCCCFLVRETRAQEVHEFAGADLKPELRELMAANMLLYQRSVGGWPKHVNNVKIDYKKELTPAEVAGVIDDKFRNDATIDNDATVKEIRFLARQYKLSGKKEYLQAVEKGLDYLLKAQYANGGWPQFYPDLSFYRHNITYNDHAMINVLNLLQDVSTHNNDLDIVNKAYVAKAASAVNKGISCILKTQVKVDGKLTVWCAQHDEKTLAPAKARSYELPSLSGMESVGILYFLMRQPHPSAKVKNAVVAGTEWLNKVKITGYRFEFVSDPSKPNGKDRVLIADPRGTIWARFYDLETGEPFFCGRDGVKKRSVTEIEHERRTGYAWYGTWAEKLLETDYPLWAKLNHVKAGPNKG